MRIALRTAMESILEGWQNDLPVAWQPAVQDVKLGFESMDAGLTKEHWEPVFPVRRGRVFPGAPKRAHIFHAFDGIAPEDVRCVVLGQDPYPCPAFSTGRAFEAGNIAEWRELNKMFSVSVRVFMQMIVAARLDDQSYASAFAQWPRMLGDIENGKIDLEPAPEIADRWVSSGALLLNSSLTLSRFQVSIDPHQAYGHLPLWRPLMLAVLRHLLALGKPLVCIGFGDAAAETLELAGVPRARTILRQHPARGDEVLQLENPFTICNAMLGEMGGAPIRW